MRISHDGTNLHLVDRSVLEQSPESSAMVWFFQLYCAICGVAVLGYALEHDWFRHSAIAVVVYVMIGMIVAGSLAALCTVITMVGYARYKSTRSVDSSPPATTVIHSAGMNRAHDPVITSRFVSLLERDYEPAVEFAHQMQGRLSQRGEDSASIPHQQELYEFCLSGMDGVVSQYYRENIPG